MQHAEYVRLYPIRDGALIVLQAPAPFPDVLDAFVRLLQDEKHRLQGVHLIIDTGPYDWGARELLALEDAVNRHLGARVLQMVQGEAAEILREEFGLQPFDVEAGAAIPPAPEEAFAQATPAPATDWSSLDRMNACMVRRTLRSGQRISYEGSIVVLGDVNAGAEVVAGGDVVVLGSLRGVAHAGARGRTDACIIALKMAATQLRIAHVIGRAPDDGDGHRDAPEMAYVNGGKIVVEPMPARMDAVFG